MLKCKKCGAIILCQDGELKEIAKTHLMTIRVAPEEKVIAEFLKDPRKFGLTDDTFGDFYASFTCHKCGYTMCTIYEYYLTGTNKIEWSHCPPIVLPPNFPVHYIREDIEEPLNGLIRAYSETRSKQKGKPPKPSLQKIYNDYYKPVFEALQKKVNKVSKRR